jgi:hypothetical protein
MKIPDQGTILSRTQTTTYVMNHILEFILKNADIADIVSLASDEGCKKWIVSAESKLKVLFKQLDILKSSGLDVLKKKEDIQGPIYFAKIEDLKSKTDSPLKVAYCKVLAFYYIRLFQIVGALALSIQDSTLPLKDYIGTETKDIVTPQQPKSTNPLIPQKKGFFNIFKGGVIEHYEFISNYIVEKDTSDKLNKLYYFVRPKEQVWDYKEERYKTKIREQSESLTIAEDANNNKYIFKNNDMKFDFTIKGNILIINNVYKSAIKLENIKIKEPFTIQENKTLRIDKTRKDLYDFILDIFNIIETYTVSNTINTLKDLKYLDTNYQGDDKILPIRGTSITLNKRELRNPNPTFIFAIEKVINGKKYTIDLNFNIDINKKDEVYAISIKNIHTTSKEFTIPDDFKEKLQKEKKFRFDNNKFMIFNSDSDELKSNKQDIPTFLENNLEKLTDKIIENMELGIGKLKEGYYQPTIDTKVDNPLKYTELWNKLSGDSPVKSFCVARALQLLNFSGLGQNIPESIKPLVYDSKFELIENKSLPSKGESITTAMPFKALDNLYKGPKDILQPVLGEKTSEYLPSSNSTRATSLESLIKSFGSTATSLENLLNIKEETGSPFNPLNKRDDADKIRVLRDKAKLLFQKQFDHTRAVLKLLNKIFNINGPNITLNTTLASQGIKGLEVIAQEARDLLSAYYAGCQTTYAEGIEELKKKPTNNTKVGGRNFTRKRVI